MKPRGLIITIKAISNVPVKNLRQIKEVVIPDANITYELQIKQVQVNVVKVKEILK